MSFILHQEALSKLCRLCGRLVTKSSANQYNTTVPTKQYAKEIQRLLHTNVWLDTEQVHPQNVCWRCIRFLRQDESASAEHRETAVAQWDKHSRTGKCETCHLYSRCLKGGRPVKRKRSGYGLPTLPCNKDVDETSALSFNIGPFVSDPVPHILDTLSTTEEILFICCICQCILGSPAVQTSCEHNFCAECLLAWFQHKKNNSVKCPVCNSLVHIADVTISPRVLRVQLKTLPTVCVRCGTIGKLDTMKIHVCPQNLPKPTCKSAVFYPSQSPIKSQDSFTAEATKAARLLKSMASKHSRGTPIPPDIEEAADRWIWLKLKQSQNVRLKTLGRPAYVKLISQVKAKEHDESVSGCKPCPDDSMSANQSLAMMRDCQLAWEQLRKLRRYLGNAGVSFPSEHTMRKQQKILLKDNICGIMTPLLFKSTNAKGMDGMETRQVPVVTVVDLSRMIIDYLDRHDLNGSLTWHNNTIPKDEIWVKIGGDKGGTSFKMCFQIVNIHHPNSKNNTVVFLCYEGDDSTVNLRKVLPPVMRQVAELHKQTWRGKSIRIFVFGDYELLTKIYGICSCNARYCCLYCEASRQQMQTPKAERGDCQQRSLQSMQVDYNAYCKDGSRKARAKDVSHSIIAQPMLDVPLDYVVLPSLHMSLGIFKKLFDMLELQCQSLDEKLFGLCVTNISEDGDEDNTPPECNFAQQVDAAVQRHNSIREERQKKASELEEVEDELPLYLLQHDLQACNKAFQDTAKRAFTLQQELQDLENTEVGLQVGTGPVVGCLDDVLQSFNVARQAYHGKSFVGNHVHRCCQADVIQALTAAPRKIIEEMSCDSIPIRQHQALIREAAGIGATFSEILMMFADVHHAINHSKPVTPDDVLKIDVCIKSFMECYRRSFPKASITPKMHLLEDHAVSQLTRFGVGFGLLNEQGGELIHTEFNRTGRVVCGMRDPLQRLLTTVQRHHLSTTPEIQKEMIKKSRNVEE